MNRRSFVAALAAIALTPKALLDQAPKFLLSRKVFSGRIYFGSQATMQRAYRKMQLHLLEGFHVEPAEWDLFDG